SFACYVSYLFLHSFPTRRSSDLFILLYGECMARMISTTIRLNKEDVRALKRARAAGHSASELVRKGLRVVASRYYTGRRPPSTRSEEHTSELQSRGHLVCRLLLE